MEVTCSQSLSGVEGGDGRGCLGHDGNANGLSASARHLFCFLKAVNAGYTVSITSIVTRHYSTFHSATCLPPLYVFEIESVKKRNLAVFLVALHLFGEGSFGEGSRVQDQGI